MCGKIENINPGNESVLQRLILFTITYKTNSNHQIEEGKQKTEETLTD